MSSSPRARQRPPFLRALGERELPDEVEAEGRVWRLVDRLKHDSWAATGRYRADDGAELTVKFNRIRAIGLLPMRWLGRRLARREGLALDQLAGTPGIPRRVQPVRVDGRVEPNICAHDWIPGHPLGEQERVGDDFFPRLHDLLKRVHAAGLAYVDLHKRENIIVGEDGGPWLIDFQISLGLPRLFPLNLLLAAAQRSDLYHLGKHVKRCRPDLIAQGKWSQGRPWWISLHRLFAVPLRSLRRRLLVAVGVRTGRGRVESEQFIEDGLRPFAPVVTRELAPTRKAA
jgi:hypothetical protein